ncbi:MAG: family 16 glycosylhydrolase [Chitinophagaceae bacterium]
MRRFLFAVMVTGLADCEGGGSNTTPAEILSKLSVDDVTLFEGSSGTTPFEFTISMDKTFSQPVSVSYSTADGTAKAGEDYIAISAQTVTFQPGERTKKVTVEVVGDTKKEGAETFTLNLSNVVNGVITKGTGTGTIRDDDEGGAFTNLVWSDEFDGPSLNLSNWTFELGDGCDKNLCGWGNNELQTYTNRSENISFSDGKMVITARKEPLDGKQYTSVRIKTEGKKTFKYGRIELRAKLPIGKGIWPAFWLLPQANVFGGWPRSGEIDLMEYLGHEPNKVHGTVHYGPGPGSIQKTATYTLPSGNFNEDFHLFSIEWDVDVIRWYVDGNLYTTVTKSSFGSVNYPFNEEFFILINMAVGGNWPGAPDATTTFPQRMEVDYVRVYQ